MEGIRDGAGISSPTPSPTGASWSTPTPTAPSAQAKEPKTETDDEIIRDLSARYLLAAGGKIGMRQAEGDIRWVRSLGVSFDRIVREIAEKNGSVDLRALAKEKKS